MTASAVPGHPSRALIAALSLGLLACQADRTAMSCEMNARVERVIPSLESALYAVVELSLANAGPSACRVLRFKVVWPGGEAQYDPKDLVVGPGQTAQRRIQVGPDRGDVPALLAARNAVRVEILQTAAQ
jgi:hypothetical protein